MLDLRPKSLRMYQGFAQELPAEINEYLLDSLHDIELEDWNRFGKVRQAREKELSDPDDVFFHAQECIDEAAQTEEKAASQREIPLTSRRTNDKMSLDAASGRECVSSLKTSNQRSALSNQLNQVQNQDENGLRPVGHRPVELGFDVCLQQNDLRGVGVVQKALPKSPKLKGKSDAAVPDEHHRDRVATHCLFFSALEHLPLRHANTARAAIPVCQNRASREPWCRGPGIGTPWDILG